MALKSGIFTALIIILLFSLVLFQVNNYYFHYVGNNYYPLHTLVLGSTISLIMVGAWLQFNVNHALFIRSRETLFFFAIMAAIALYTNAIQYTPFLPIDKKIISYEYILGIDLLKFMAWTAQYPHVKKLLTLIYNSLNYQMSVLPLLMIFLGHIHKIRQYYFLLLITAILGFSFYYLFPTTGPASNLNSPLFNSAQYATGIKFREIHAQLLPSTLEGGMIAFPSFHVIWAWFCVFLVWEIKGLRLFLLPINFLLIASCVLLGWHYPLDLVGSLVLIIIAHSFLNYFSD